MSRNLFGIGRKEPNIIKNALLNEGATRVRGAENPHDLDEVAPGQIEPTPAKHQAPNQSGS